MGLREIVIGCMAYETVAEDATVLTKGREL